MTLDPYNAFIEHAPDAPTSSGSLTGITVGVKANIAVAGLHWTAGMALFRDRIASEDAEVVARLRAAGASITGILNMEEAALGAKTDNPWFGATHNPHRMGHTPGGSSGGSGAAVAAGLCDAALGTDTMGSIRIPAAYCGIYGFKPGPERVSQHGLELAEPGFDAIGPLARSLDLLEKVARVISEFGEAPAALGCATLADLGAVECEPAVLEGFGAARSAIGEIAHVTLPHPLSRVRYAGFIRTVRFMATHFADADPALLSDHLRRLIAYGPRRAEADWAEDQRVLAETADAVRAIVADHGTLLLPTAPQTAFAHCTTAPANQADFTCLANVAGLPALALPAGFSADGLPVGVQLIGATGSEVALFARARALDAALAAYRPPTLAKEPVP
ncbi:MAG: amidase [Blastomonas sp.]|uniref:amidase n=1 Tax=Blastomonas sp. TaxID=1909299 RepID=UPI00258E854F|nr:amidase [Blastomonas sp.]MCO5791508.1 amidase [Blastomonas sp.]